MRWQIPFSGLWLLCIRLWADCPTAILGPDELGRIQSKDITEASGLAASWRNPGVFWTHNDGPREKVFALSGQGELLAVFKLPKAVSDFEDLAVGPGPTAGVSYLYAGDIGSNNADRDQVQVARVPEPAVSLTGGVAGTTDFTGADFFTLKYPSGKFNAEALLIDPVQRMLVIVTKEDDGAHLFKISLDSLLTGQKATLESAGQIAFSKVSGGAISRDGSLIAVRREEAGLLWRRSPGEDLLSVVQRSGEELALVGPPAEPNGEAITFLPDASGYLTLSEGLQQPLFAFRFAPAPATPSFVTTPQFVDGALELQVLACAGSTVVVQQSGDLRHWQDLEIFTAGIATHRFVDFDVVVGRFYRLISP